jgi:Putative beta barrel porin-7 (BBP7)
MNSMQGAGALLVGAWLAFTAVAHGQETSAAAGGTLALAGSKADSCAGDCWAECGPCTTNSTWYAGVDYLLWWMKDPRLPFPVVTSGSPGAGNPGALNDPATQVLLGPGGLNYPVLSGVRATLGLWLDSEQTTSVEVSGFWLQRAHASYTAGSDAGGNPVLANPLLLNFPGGPLGQEGANLVAFPGSYAGAISVANATQLWGVEANLTGGGFDFGGDRLRGDVRWLGGLRYLNLTDTTSISETSSQLANAALPQFFLGQLVPFPATIVTQDRFAASNQFLGPQIGFRAEASAGRWSAGLSSELALGWNQEFLAVQGNSALIQPGLPAQVAAGGLYAQPSNIGRYTSNVFEVIPEVNTWLGVRLGERALVSVGYDFLFLSHVVRSEDQLDRRIDLGQVAANNLFYTPGFVGQDPALPFHQTNMWVQGLTFSLRFNF